MDRRPMTFSKGSVYFQRGAFTAVGIDSKYSLELLRIREYLSPLN